MREKHFIMEVMGRFVVVLLLMLFGLTPAVVFAQESGSSRIDLTINQGPGFLLPTSPFYFADIFKNNLRLLLATGDNSKKAKIHLDIAGERIAEVRVMLENGNMPQYALNAALLSMVEHVDGAKTALKQAKSRGKNVEKLAGELNVIVNNEKDSLRVLEAKTDRETSLKIRAELAKVEEIEVGIEDEMVADLLQNERKHQLTQTIVDEQRSASEAANNAARLQEEFDKEFAVASSGAKPSVAGAATESGSKKQSTKSATPAKKTERQE